MYLLVYVQFTILFCASKCTSLGENSDVDKCPTWTYPSPPHNQCVCGDSIGDAVICNPKAFTAKLIVKHFCVFLSEELQTTLIGTCPYGDVGILPRNVSNIEEDDRLCFYLHRRGPLCGACEKNYTLPAYSYYLGCIECKNYKNGWIKLLVAAFLPLTFFYIVVITFRISVTSSTLNAFVMTNQIFASPAMIRYLYSSNLVTDPYPVSYSAQFSADFLLAILSIWNLDFFRSFYEGICLYPGLKYQQVLLLEYAIGVYPLFLIFLTYVLVKLHDNFGLVIWLWKPFHRCLVHFRRKWNIRSNLVHALATFIVLSYVKILNTSFELLMPSHVYDMQGNGVNKVYWYYDGRVHMASKDYLPYLVLALFMLLIFNVLPLALLALYPFGCFQRFLDCCLSLKCKLPLQIYMDTFHGCYEDITHDYRHFASLYLAVRFINLLMASICYLHLYVLAAVLLFVFTLALVAKFQPYKNKKHNRVDIITLLVFISVYIAISMRYFEGGKVFPKWVKEITISIAVLLLLSYMLFLILSRVVPLNATLCVSRFKIFLTRRITEAYNGEMNVEDQALLIHGSANYNSCQ